MSDAVRAATRSAHHPAAAVVLTFVVTVACVVLALDGRDAGLRYGSTSYALLVPLPAAVMATAAAAWWLSAALNRQVARWMAVVSGTLLCYLGAIAAAVQYAGVGGNRGPVAEVLVAAHLVGALVPVAVFQLCLVAAVTSLTGPTGLLRALRSALIALTGTYLVAGALFLPPGSPFADMSAIWELPAAEVATQVVGTAIWVVAVLVGPFVVWRAAASSGGDARRRLSLLAACSLMPVVTIGFCIVGMSLASPADLMSVELGEAILAIAYCVPFLLLALGVPVALRPDLSVSLVERIPKIVAATVTVVVGALFGILAVTVSALLGLGLGDDALLGIVVLTVAVAAVLTPVRVRLSRRLALTMDPARAVAARLVGRLDDAARARPAEAVQDILRASLADPTARLVLRLPDDRGWADVAGAVVEPPEEGAAVPNPSGASPLAYVVHNGRAVDAAGAIVETQPLIDQAVLEATIRDRSERIAAEKERADRAAADERRRLERDLHDGVQGRLLALALDLRMAQRTLSDGDAQLVLSDATDGLQRAIDELRTLASGETPELLGRRGLGPALAELCRRLPVPVTISVPERRLPPSAETVAYLVICEAVTNALKHAEADIIDVRVGLASNVASIEVSDDGRGGADLRAGTGLRGMSERVRAAGGRLVISSRQPMGTTVEVILPCES